MSTYNESVGDVDIIFAGGGTAACVAAGRLAKANPDLKILLVEGGANNFENPTVVNPAVYLSHLAPDSKTALVQPLPTPIHFYPETKADSSPSSTNRAPRHTSMTAKPSCPWVVFWAVVHPSIS
jgi:choline dehydrogenase-like flavoprotein